MKKIVALVLSLVMALSLCTVAFAAVENDDVLYDGLTYGTAKEYVYVDGEYEAGANNYLPYLYCKNDGNYYAIATSGTVLYDGDMKASGLYLGDVITDWSDYLYNYKGEKQAAQAWSCTKDQLKAGFVFVGSDDETYYATEDKNGTYILLVDGKIVKTALYTPVAGQHILYYTGAAMTEVKVGVYQVKCAACQKDILISKDNINGAGYLYENDFEDYSAWSKATGKTAAFPANAKLVLGTWYVLEDAAASTTTEGVNSAKTFDAGVAMYVGMSLLSVAGGAVVIGKKKEF